MPEFLVGPDNGWDDDGEWRSFLTTYDDDFPVRVTEAKTPQAAARAWAKSYGLPENGIAVRALHEAQSFTVAETHSVSVKPR